VLLGAESSSKSEKRLCEALHAFHGVSENDPIATDPSVTIKQYVKGIVGPRSRFLHGTWSTLGENAEATRADAEALSWGLLRLSSLALDRYRVSKSPADSATAFLDWINAEREAGGQVPQIAPRCLHRCHRSARAWCAPAAESSVPTPGRTGVGRGCYHPVVNSTGQSRHFGFHSRASFCASAICAGIILAAVLSRNSIASFAPAAAAKFAHLWALT
jgi:hypothetical protein